MATAIKIDSFGGIQPRLDPTSLADTQATLAKNCRLHTTKLHPIQQALKVTDFPVRIEGGLTDVADAKTIEVWRRGENNRDVIAWPGLVTVAPSNIHDDNRFRIFVTGDTGVGDANGENQPCALISSKDGKTYDRHRIFITVPPAASVENSVSMDELDVANLRYAFFFQTWVDEYGYESGMSPVLLDEDGNMVEVQYNDGDSITWKGVAASDIPSGVTKRRLYKTVAGSSEATDSIKFVIEQKMVGDMTYFDEYSNIIVKDEDTGEVTSSITSIPVDLVWMSAMPGNFYVGFPRSNPRQICFSDVNLPTSFPDAYKYSIRDYAMGIAVAGNTAFILTKGYPWAISGTDPNGMTAAQIVSEQAVEGGTMKDMTRLLAQRWRETARMEDPRFTDASGRTWNTVTYLTMNVRTNTMRVYNDCLLDDIARVTGSDIARISKGGSDPHCVCAAWEGCIISISGKTKGLPTYEQAKNGGCFHPNCVHTLEYIDEDADAEEIALQKAHPVTKGLEDDPDAQDGRKYEIDQDRYRRQGMTEAQARMAVDRDNLTAAIRTGLIRSDARALVDALTDAQVSALCVDGNPPRFEPTKRATRQDPHAADEIWRHGSRGGVVHIARDADAAKLIEVCNIKDAKAEWQPTTPLEKATDALMQSIGAKHTDEKLDISGVNPNYSKGGGYTNNCQRCVPTYEARCRGYDVEALSSNGDKIPGVLNLAGNSRAVWKNQTVETFTAKKFKTGVEKRMAEWGDGARAELRIGWKGLRWGHVFVAVQENGSTKFLDPQNPTKDASQYFALAATRGGNAFHWMLRIDNNEFTDEAKRCFRSL